MKNNTNKFIKHLSDDIVTQNHHLKGQVIKIRKVLRSYEEKMVQQFLKLAKQFREESQQGFFFQTPEDYLNYFIKALNRTVSRSLELQQKNKTYEITCKQLKHRNQFLEKITEELTNKQKITSAKFSQLEKEYETISQKFMKIQSETKQNQRKLKLEIFKLKQQLRNLQNQYNIKFLEQRKSILEKANKDIARLRVEMDMELHQKQKVMKQENDKRDKQIKNLLITINLIAQRKEGSFDHTKTTNKTSLTSSLRLPEPSRKHSEVSRLQEPAQTLDSFSILTEVVKPFTEHTKLLQKLSEARKEILQLKNQNRQQSTNLSVLTLSMSQKQNEIDLFNQKFLLLKTNNDSMYQELTQVKAELDKNIQDKQQMEKYYNERWNSEINKVKYNMERKFIDKQNSLEEEYKSLSEVIEQQREDLRIKKQIMEKQCLQLKKINEVLRQQIKVLDAERKSFEASLKQSIRKLQQIEMMHNEDIKSTRLRFLQTNQKWIQQMAKDQKRIKDLLKQIQNIHLQHKTHVVNLKEELQVSYQRKLNQNEAQQIRRIDEKNREIEKLAKEIQTRQEFIESFQREESEKMEDLRKKASKQKQRQMRDLKVSHFQQIGKLNQKILKLQEKLKILNNQSLQKNFQFTNQLAEKQAKLTNQTAAISQLELVIKSIEFQKKNLQTQVTNLQGVVTSHLSRIASLNTQIKSIQLINKQKDSQISILIGQKQHWVNDINNCRKQFEKGFKQLKQLNEKKVSYYRSRIWELERICEIGGISKKDYERIRALTEEKKKLEEKITMKEAENLILNQVKNYYENKSKELDSKMVVAFELKDDKKPLFMRKPKRNSNHLKILKTQVSEDLDGFQGNEAIQIKRFLDSTRNKDRSQGKLQTADGSEYKLNSRVMSRSNVRVNSSLI